MHEILTGPLLELRFKVDMQFLARHPVAILLMHHDKNHGFPRGPRADSAPQFKLA